MGDFEPRPKGTVMYGAFADYGRAERALRVLQNAGYARAAVATGPDALPGDPVVVVVDAAAAGAVRAREILEEHGAQLRASLRETPRPQPLPEAEHGIAPISQAERKPRVRRRVILETPTAATPPAAPPPARRDVTIVTRTIDIASTNHMSPPPSALPAPNSSQPILP